jgi:hypothetical protein
MDGEARLERAFLFPETGIVSETTQDTSNATAAADAAAFESGYSQARAEHQPAAPAEARPAEKAEETTSTQDPPNTSEGAGNPDPQKTQEAKPAEDEWAGVAPKVRTELEALRGMVAKVEKVPDRLRNIEGHIGGLVATTRELRAALDTARTAATAAGAKAPTDTEVKQAARNPELWKQLKEDFPVWADAIEPELADIRAAIAAVPRPQAVDVGALKGEVTKDLQPLLEAAAAHGRGMARIDRKYEGWEEMVKTPDFEAWVAAAPPETQALSRSSKPADAEKMLDAYAEHRKKQAEKAGRTRRLDAVTAPRGTTAVTPMTSDDEAFEQGYKEARGNV